jgi:hypothetical protein
LTETIDRVLGESANWERMRQSQRRFVENERTWLRSV